MAGREQGSQPWAFLKAHGLGNDFLLHRVAEGEAPPGPAVLRWLCDRRLGPGADGVILLWPASGGAGCSRMALYNADGSEAEISGNGLRCAVAALGCWWAEGKKEHGSPSAEGAASGRKLAVQTGAGLRWGRVVSHGGEQSEGIPAAAAVELTAEVSMGRPCFDAAAIPLADGVEVSSQGIVRLAVGADEVEGVPVSLGNPHLVVAGPLPGPEDVLRLGPLLERHASFPRRINVIWMSPPERGSSELRIWERGCGVTQACGSGACAAAAVAGRRGWAGPGEVLQLRMAGGVASVRLPASDDEELLLTGPVRLVARGEAYLGEA